MQIFSITFGNIINTIFIIEIAFLLVFVVSKILMHNKFTTFACCLLIGIYSGILFYLANGENDNNDGVNRAFQHGDFILGGLFDASNSYDVLTGHCSQLNPLGIHQIQAMIYAIQRINANSSLLPNVTLGYDIRDICAHSQLALRYAMDYIKYDTDIVANATNTLDFIRGRVAGVIGAFGSRESIAAATVFSNFGLLQISYGATSRRLSSVVEYKSFFRTIPSDDYQVDAITIIIARFKWNYIGIVAVGDAFGESMGNSLLRSTTYRGICIPIFSKFNIGRKQLDITKIIKQLIAKPNIQGIVLICHANDALLFFREAKRLGLTDRTYIAITDWSGTPLIKQFPTDIARGSIGVMFPKRNLHQFEQYLKKLNLCNNKANPWFQKLFQQTRKNPSCDLPSEASSSDFYAYNAFVGYIIDAVYAVAYSLHNMLECKPGDGCAIINNRVSASKIDVRQLYKFTYNVTFDGITAHPFRFDKTGDGVGNYNYCNLQIDPDTQTLRNIVIGNYSSTSTTTNSSNHFLDVTQIIWHSGATIPPDLRCSMDCQPGTYRLVSVNERCCWTCPSCPARHYSNTTNTRHCYDCATGYASNSNGTGCLAIFRRHLRITDTPALVVVVLISIFASLTITTCMLVHKKRHNLLIQETGYILNILLLIGILCNFALPIFLLVPVTISSCVFSFISFSFFTSLIFLILLMKIAHVNRIQDERTPGENKSTILSNIAVQLFVLVLMLMFQGMVYMLILRFDRMVVGIDEVTSRKVVYLFCKTDDNGIAIYAYLKYSLLNVLCIYRAYKARDVPVAGYESRYILLASLLALGLFSFMAPAYFFTTGIMKFGLAAIGAVAFPSLIFICLYLRKIIAILFPNKESSS